MALRRDRARRHARVPRPELIRFEHWLAFPLRGTAPNMDGLWGEALAITHRIYRRKVFTSAT